MKALEHLKNEEKLDVVSLTKTDFNDVDKGKSLVLEIELAPEIELPDYNLDVKATLKQEGLNILKKIDSKDFVITLEIDGNMLNSLELAEKIRTIQINNPTIAFVIGGSNGLDESVKARSNYALSFSKLTFPHQLFRLNILEQIFRAYKIINNEAYHK